MFKYRCFKEVLKINTLSNEQVNAIRCDKENILVSAGPGSGKTTLIINKIDYLIREKKVNPKNIIVITFTKAASNNMRNRYKKLSNSSITPFFGTFHGLFYKILTNYYGEIKIIESSECFRVVKNFLTSYMDEVSDEKVKDYISNISLFKSSNSSIDNFPTTLDKDTFTHCFNIYEQYKKEKSLYDFDDLQIICKNLFIKNTKLLNSYSNSFKYMLVDEFQDCDEVQIEILKLLKNDNNYLFAVGDEDQCIYSFRGSRPEYMVNFQKHFKNSEILYLSTNYRCRKNIVDISMNLIKNNVLRNDKTILSKKDYDGNIKIIKTNDDNESAKYISNYIGKIMASEENVNYKDFAVLYRTNIESRRILDTFIRNSIPFSILDKNYNFFQHFICEDILSYLKLSFNFTDKQNFLQIINKPFRYISKNILNEIRNSNDNIDCFEFLKSQNGIKDFQRKNLDNLKKDISYLNKISLNSAVAFIIHDLGYYDYLKEYAENQKIDLKDLEGILNEFTNICLEHNSIPSLLAYIKQYNSHLASSVREKEGVTLSTIHGVKGMEFKNVFIINLVEGYIPYDNNINENLEEERRLCYVGITRAIDNLFLLVPKKVQNKSYKPSRFLKESKHKNKLPFKLKDKVKHKGNGIGTVSYIDDDVIEIDFNNEKKKFDLAVLCEYNLIELL